MIISFLTATLKQRDGRLNQAKPKRGFNRLLTILLLLQTVAYLD